MSDILPVGEVAEAVVAWINDTFGWLLDWITMVMDMLVSGFQDGMAAIPPVLLIVIFAVLAYLLTRKNLKISLLTLFGLLFIYLLDLWPETVLTLALVLTSTFVTLAIAIPLGILASRYTLVNAALRPALDLMQTMPSFVYLIPAVIFFGLGNVPGMIATIIFAMPPAIRLTNLGIRQVPVELIEVSEAFGATEWQKLMKVQLPVALPTIMAGVNQCIMLALSMTVIAAMIGAAGLGLNVLIGIQRVDIGGGFEAGLCIVIIAIILDRITQNVISSGQQKEI
ncbi:proline/glycine betaine ABC transporter permease [Methanogenium marinum]|uniref:Proline/glycine betaine ABC transporter permease n=1 Tax=Methanogenium marinum TaxID=348610 RepID=A0A9Q4KVQ0_9EURY|nr:proline/glycine betaine ABC transporter permease [Methanogenium marinum]MDE4908406.1 proline/glycine betaine ABC transporter permease [Methanogenium marinum]